MQQFNGMCLLVCACMLCVCVCVSDRASFMRVEAETCWLYKQNTSQKHTATWNKYMQRSRLSEQHTHMCAYTKSHKQTQEVFLCVFDVSEWKYSTARVEKRIESED